MFLHEQNWAFQDEIKAGLLKNFSLEKGNYSNNGSVVIDTKTKMGKQGDWTAPVSMRPHRSDGHTPTRSTKPAVVLLFGSRAGSDNDVIQAWPRSSICVGKDATLWTAGGLQQQECSVLVLACARFACSCHQLEPYYCHTGSQGWDTLDKCIKYQMGCGLWQRPCHESCHFHFWLSWRATRSRFAFCWLSEVPGVWTLAAKLCPVKKSTFWRLQCCVHDWIYKISTKGGQQQRVRCLQPVTCSPGCTAWCIFWAGLLAVVLL